MALVYADRVLENCLCTGTADFELLGEMSTYQTFLSGIGIGNECVYSAYGPGGPEWEVGIGTVGNGALSRDTILASSNNGSIVDWPLGGKYISVVHPGVSTWEDEKVSASSVKLLGEGSDATWTQFATDGAGSRGVYALAFSNLIDNEIIFTVQLSHTWEEGTNIRPHVHWSPSSAESGGVTWALEYTWTNVNSTFANTTTILAQDTASEVFPAHQIAGFDEIDGTGKTISSMLICRLYRDVSDDNDTYANNAFLLEIDFHYRKQVLASFAEYSK